MLASALPISIGEGGGPMGFTPASSEDLRRRRIRADRPAPLDAARKESSMRTFISALVLVLFHAVSSIVAPAVAHEAGRLDLSRLVVVGDSLSAGFQNGSLLDAQQIHGYASVVASQAGGSLRLPMLVAPGLAHVVPVRAVFPPH